MTSSEGMTTTLLLVDIQNDFHPGGSLAIPTANEDSHRVAQLIQQHSAQITRVVATMDSHVKLHIAHPGFWVDGNDDKGRHPDPFTVIESKDIVAGKWKPRDDLKMLPGSLEESVFGSSLDGYTTNNTGADDGSLDLCKYAIEYTKRLEERGEYTVMSISYNTFLF
jgi:nicotinamidase/pyrazinamidase